MVVRHSWSSIDFFLLLLYKGYALTRLSSLTSMSLQKENIHLQEDFQERIEANVQPYLVISLAFSTELFQVEIVYRNLSSV